MPFQKLTVALGLTLVLAVFAMAEIRFAPISSVDAAEMVF
jgi:hypothetical protein